MTDLTEKLRPYPNLSKVVDEVIRIWPEHRKYCETRFKNDDDAFLARTEEFATLALRNVGDQLERYVSDYRWMCERFHEEEIFFFREDRYRLSTFQQAYDEVYSNIEYMLRYVHGILISQIIWNTHAQAFDAFRQHYLPNVPAGASYLEVGPGHGFYLYFASRSPNIANMEAWDVSPASIQETTEALQRMGVTRDIKLIEQDVLAAPTRHEEFDCATISEVLEHLEHPERALKSLHSALKPGGLIFINVPLNSPAPDHIYLWRSPDEFRAFVESHGFKVEHETLAPVGGYSVERALKYKVTISSILVARKV